MEKIRNVCRPFFYIIIAVILVMTVCFTAGCSEPTVNEPSDTTGIDETGKDKPEDTTGNPEDTKQPEVNDTTTTDTTTTVVDTTTATPDTTNTPVTDTPTTNTPVTDAPVTDAPVTDAPVTEPPITDTPIINTGRPTVTEYPVNRSERVDDSFFADAVFVGDSRTQGLQLYGDIKNTTFYAYQGLNVITAMTNNFIEENGQKYTVPQALARHPEFRKIYICLGVNEFWLATATYKHHYEVLIDAIMEANPNAAIYMYSIFPLSRDHSKASSGLNNEHMAEFNEAALDIAKSRGIYFVDTAQAFVKADGTLWLDSSESPDGVHLNRTGVNKLTDYIRAHTK
ncbi:MAG: hypothetical protein E7574_00330 [Ruminococcaceae bacterium]|nr:hypothetical protein [Oscillospiraceae bacterium]